MPRKPNIYDQIRLLHATSTALCDICAVTLAITAKNTKNPEALFASISVVLNRRADALLDDAGRQPGALTDAIETVRAEYDRLLVLADLLRRAMK